METAEIYEYELPQAEEPALTGYSEKASSAEMTFAGQYLNFAGMAFFALGILYYFKTAAQSTAEGLLPTLAGALSGLALVVAGHLNFRNGRRQYAEPLLAGGFALLLVSSAAAHFSFGLLPKEALFAITLILMGCSGMAVFLYDSRLIGNLTLVAVFLAPLWLTFDLSQLPIVVGYLFAVNLGITAVAYYKKWDYQLIVAFLGSYALYIHNFGLYRHLQATLGFMAGLYLLFLVANNLVHFRDHSGSDYNLFLSFINPTAFAALSYTLLLQTRNSVAVAAYLTIAALHLGLSRAAYRRKELGSSFVDIATNNLALGVLFATASISFIANFSTGIGNFELVTIVFFGSMIALWFAEALALLWLADKLEDFRSTLEGYSYLCLLLVVVQLVVVLPWLPSLSGRVGLELLSAVAFLAYALLAKKLGRPTLVSLSGVAAVACLLWAAIECGFTLTSLHPLLTLPLALALYELSYRRPQSPGLRPAAGALGALGTSMAFQDPFISLAAAGLWIAATTRMLRWAPSHAPLGGVLSGVMLTVAAGQLSQVEAVAASYALICLASMLVGLRIEALRGLLSLAQWAAPLVAWIALTNSGSAGLHLLLGLTCALAAAFLLIHCEKANLVAILGMAELLIAGALAEPGLTEWSLLACLLSVVALALCDRFDPLLDEAGKVALLTAFVVMLGALLAPLSYQLLVTLAAATLACAYGGQTMAREGQERNLFGALTGLGVLKSFLVLDTGALSTILTAAVALGLLQLAQKYQQHRVGDGARWLFFVAFLKSILFDGSFVASAGGLKLAMFGRLTPWDYLLMVVTVALFILPARVAGLSPDQRNFHLLLAQMVLAFQSTVVLYNYLGILEQFQVVLSVCWCLFSFFFIAFGIYQELKVFRLFGLVTLVASVLKICFVDIWVLGAYSIVTTFVIIGALMMVVSFLYQLHSEKLTELPTSAQALPLAS